MSIYRYAFFVALLAVVSAFNVRASYAGMAVNPSSLNFGSVSVNTTSSPRVVTLTNFGKHNLTVQQASSNLPEFILTGPSLPLTLTSGGTVSFEVAFKPDSANSFLGNLSFTTRSGTIKTVLVSGTGIIPPPSPTQTYMLSTSTSSLSLGNVAPALLSVG
jgi:hypothetical protein